MTKNMMQMETILTSRNLEMANIEVNWPVLETLYSQEADKQLKGDEPVNYIHVKMI